MEAKLVAEEGIQKGLNLPLTEGQEWIIGRDPESCQLVVEDPSCSRKHLRIQATGDGFLVENLSQTNPAALNGMPIEEATLLQEGDTLQLGETLLRFHSGQEPSFEQVPTEDELQDSIYRETSEEDKGILAEIDFDLTQTGRFLLKVVSGPNAGAEFSMQKGTSYIIGTDPNSCDIVFHDTSVSRQHAKLYVSENETLSIEDLNSKNGTLVDSDKIESKMPITSQSLVTLGTTSFMIYDREGEMHTIISPMLPGIVKMLQKEEEVEKQPEESVQQKEEAKAEKAQTALGAFILTGILTGLFLIMGIAMTTLFQSEAPKAEKEYNVTKELDQAITAFPDVRYSFNKTQGRLLLVGHVKSGTEKKELMYNLQGLPFIKSVDDSGLVIDEYVWREINQILIRNPKWKGISIQSPRAGTFVVSGYLQTRKEAEDLNDYITSNFPYPDLLERKVIVEEEITSSVEARLANAGIRNIDIKISNGELSLTGGVTQEKKGEFQQLAKSFKDIPGIRNVRLFITDISPEASLINITDKYNVSGVSRQGGKNVNVVINGRILTKGDILDSMRITEIKPGYILLEKDGVQYRIDYSQ